MFKITRSARSGTTTLALSGRIGAEHLAELGRVVEEEHGHRVVLDLREVNVIDVDVVRFLAECVARGIQLAHCPAYVQEWMVREKLTGGVTWRRKKQPKL